MNAWSAMGLQYPQQYPAMNKVLGRTKVAKSLQHRLAGPSSDETSPMLYSAVAFSCLGPPL
jgi:hypothetical protein